MAGFHYVIDNHFKNNSRAIQYEVTRVVAVARSSFQEILVADLVDFGRALLLDGSPQSSELDEGIYHQALVHPALVACPNPKKVFIAGGGEGACVREILRHPSIERVVMVDIDPVLVSIAREHLTTWHQGTFEDPRVTLLHQDARAYLAETDEKFDAIIVDVADPLEDSPAALLYTHEFYSICKDHLTSAGTLAVQAEAADICDFQAHVCVVKTLKAVFPVALPYTTSIPFFGSNWGFVVAGNETLSQALEPQAVEKKLKERGLENLQQYDAIMHQHMFSLPRFLRQALADPTVGTVLYDDQPMVVT